MNSVNKFYYTAILTSFNAEETLTAALDSIFNQNIPPKEIIVVDDFSADNTKLILDSVTGLKNIQVIKNQQNLGQSYSRNLAVEASSCDYAIIFDDDDVSAPERAQFHSEMFQKGSLLNFVSSSKFYKNGAIIQNLNSDVSLRGISEVDALRKVLIGGNIDGFSKLNIPASTCAFSISHIKNMGGYDTEFRRLEDADLFIRACAHDLQISWTSKIGVVRYASYSEEKGGSLESDFEDLLLSKHRDLLPAPALKKYSFQIRLRRLYFDRNVTEILKFLVTNPYQTLANVRKVKGFAKRVLHDFRILGSS